MRKYLLPNVQVLSGPNNGFRDVVISSGRIREIHPPNTIAADSDTERLNTNGCLLFDSVLDDHVHFREPGPVAYKEGWTSGSIAALRGGVSSVCEVQNSHPLCDSVEALIAKNTFVGKTSYVNYGLYANVLESNADNLKALAPYCIGYKLFMGHSTGGLGIWNDKIFTKAAECCAETGRPLVVHAEDGNIIEENLKRCANAMDLNRLRPPEAEASATRVAIELSRQTGAKVHVFHISCEGALNEIRRAKDDGLKVTAAVCPHHLLFDTEDAVKDPALMKVFPPLRPPSDRKALLAGLSEGIFDVLQSDHAPHLLSEKHASFEKAPGGFPGIEFFVRLGMKLVFDGLVSLEALNEMISANPREVIGLDPYRVIEGERAEFTICEQIAEREIQASEIASRCGWSPYIGYPLPGKIRYVFVRGQLALAHDNIKARAEVVSLAEQSDLRCYSCG